MGNEIGKFRLPAIPASRLPTDEFRNLRRLKTVKTLVEFVEPLYLKCREDEEFLKFVDAVNNDQAITGSTKFDDAFAAQFIVKQAQTDGVPEVTTALLYDVSKALNTAMRRYNEGREQRRRIAIANTIVLSLEEAEEFEAWKAQREEE